MPLSRSVDQDPTLITATLSVILQLESVGHEIAESLLRYVHGISAIKLGPNHPLTQLWSHMRSIGLGQVRHVAAAVVKAHYDQIQQQLHPKHSFYQVTPRPPVERQATYHDFAKYLANDQFTCAMMEIEENRTSDVDEVYIEWAQSVLGYYLQQCGGCPETGHCSGTGKKAVETQGQKVSGVFCQVLDDRRAGHLIARELAERDAALDAQAKVCDYAPGVTGKAAPALADGSVAGFLCQLKKYNFGI
jgi:hypothetical protein